MLKVDVCLAATLMLAVPVAAELHVIQVIDDQTQRGVPMVELCTTSNVCFVTDSHGLIALSEPAYWNQDVFFTVRSHGYQHQRDFFGTPGRSLRIARGSKSIVKITRTNVAERLYRATGEGIYRDSVLAGRKAPLAQSLLNSSVTGLDTVMHTVYAGRLFWLFGDTNRLSASLGNFAATGARSDLPDRGGLSPETGIDLRYMRAKDGFVKPMADIPGEGMKWMFALMVLRDPMGVNRLVARYDRMKSLEEPYDSGLAVFDDKAEVFRPLVSFGPNPGLSPNGRVTRVLVQGSPYFYFSWPHATPAVRVPATWDAVRDLSKYEGFACTTDTCRWERGSKPAAVLFIDIETGQRVEGNAGSVEWNSYRNRWIAIIQKNVGEVWYAEADTPTGPWAYARRIVQHDRYTFYWPGQIAEFDREGGKRIYFLGTYTHAFSGNPMRTPRYDYNQILYALSLDDPRVHLPVAYYEVRGQSALLAKEEIDRLKLWTQVQRVAHYAYQLGRGPANAKLLPNPDARPMFDRGATSPMD